MRGAVGVSGAGVATVGLEPLRPHLVRAGLGRLHEARRVLDQRQFGREVVAAGLELAARRSRRRRRWRPAARAPRPAPATARSSRSRGGRAGSCSGWHWPGRGAPRRRPCAGPRRAWSRRRAPCPADSCCASGASVATRRCLGAGRADRAQQQLERRAVVHHRLAPQQVERLDAVGALVDRVDAVVAVVLLDRILARVAVAAEDLDRQVVGLERVVRAPGLDDRRQQLEQQRRSRAARPRPGPARGRPACRRGSPAPARPRRSTSAAAACAARRRARSSAAAGCPDPSGPDGGPGGARARTAASTGIPRSPAAPRPCRRRCAPRSSCGTCRPGPGAAGPPGSRRTRRPRRT